MVVALSRFRVANGCEGAVREAFQNRPGLVDNVSGFLGLEAFADSGDAALFYLITRWTDAESFRRWHSSSDHKESHAGIPKELKLDPSFTQLCTLQRISSRAVFSGTDSTRDSATLIAGFLDRSTTVYWLEARADGRIVACNAALKKIVGNDLPEGSLLWPLLTAPSATELRGLIAGAKREPSSRYRFNFVDREQMPFTLECHIDVQADCFVLIGEPISDHETRLQRELIALNNELAVQLRETDRQTKALRKAKAELEQALRDLCESQRHLARIQEVIPICMICGKVKNRESRWEDVAQYFQRNNLSLSHGYCPDCGQREIDKLEQ